MRKLALSIAAAALALAQTPAPNKPPAFEVASIKPTVIKDGSFGIDFPPGGRFSGRGMTVQNLLRISYELQDHQIAGGPSWIDSEGFDIEARPAAGAGEPSRQQVREMIQSLLAERFHLELHRETRQLPIYALIVSKAGPKLQAADANASANGSIRVGQLVTRKMSMASLASILTFDLGRPVKDDTALKGEFAFSLEWAPGLSASDDGASGKPSLFAAVQDQLGLKLESTKGPIEVVVIDRVEKPSEN